MSGRETLAPNEGMLFVFAQPGIHHFWMKGMNFPLDFIWIRDKVVVEITEDVTITVMDLYPHQPVDQVAEVNSGVVAGQQIKIGDKVSYEPVSD